VATFSEIQTKVQTWLRDFPTDTLAEIPSLINDSQRELQRQHNFRVMEAVVSLTTVDATNDLGTIADFKEPRADPFWTDLDGGTTPFDWQPSLDYLVQRYQADSEGSPKYLYWEETSGAGVAGIQVFPLSDGLSQHPGGQYPITIPYWKFLPALSGAGDTNWFTIFGDKYLRLHAVGWGHMLNLDEDRAGPYLRAADIEAQLIIRADKLTRVKRPNVFRYSVNAGNQMGRQINWRLP